MSMQKNGSTMHASGKVLIVDDEPIVRQLFSEKLKRVGFSIDEVSSIEDAMQSLTDKAYDAVLLDNYLGDKLGLSYLPEIVAKSPCAKVVVLTGHGSIECAVNALSEGASGFLVKSDPIDANIDKFCQLLENTRAMDVDEVKDTFASHGIVTQCHQMYDIFRKLAKVSPTDTTVLINGESGTGKELIAKAIHMSSSRSGTGPFLAVNCGAISENLLEAELFGSKKGAFTGANRDRRGYFEACHNGTLFLDEIGEMSPQLQVKLLRVLQEKEITPVGGTQPVKVNTRIVAATNCNLLRDMKRGRFREDLYYRLSVIKIDLPPLRDRLGDIPLLVQYFINRFNAKFGKQVKPPSCNLMAKLKAYSWPGNVRELHNAIERATLLAENNELRIEDLIPVKAGLGNGDGFEAAEKFVLPLDYSEAKTFFEKTYVEQLLSASAGNISEAAKVSKQYRPAIYRLINKYDLDANAYRHTH